MKAHLPGEAAALLAAVCWSLSAMCWTSAGRRVGSLIVNTVRLCIALSIFLLYGHFARGEVLPFSAPLACWGWLGVSGLLGFFLCDLFLFQSLVLMGPRIPMLIFSLAPVVAAFFGRLWLHEVLLAWDVTGMAIALTGVLWVVSEAPARGRSDRRTDPFSRKGLLFAFLAMVNQGLAAVFSKLGMEGMESAAAATQIRIVAGLPGFVVLILLMGKQRECLKVVGDRKTMGIISLGSIAGPILGVGLLMHALKTVPTGVAMTLVSVMPVVIIPLTVLIYKERVTPRAVFGSIVAVIGTAMLSL